MKSSTVDSPSNWSTCAANAQSLPKTSPTPSIATPPANQSQKSKPSAASTQPTVHFPTTSTSQLIFKVHKVFHTKNKQSPGPKINDPHLSTRHYPASKCDRFAFGHIFNCNHNDKRHWEFTKTAALIYVANAFRNIGTVQKMLYFKIETILFH